MEHSRWPHMDESHRPTRHITALHSGCESGGRHHMQPSPSRPHLTNLKQQGSTRLFLAASHLPWCKVFVPSSIVHSPFPGQTACTACLSWQNAAAITSNTPARCLEHKHYVTPQANGTVWSLEKLTTLLSPRFEP